LLTASPLRSEGFSGVHTGPGATALPPHMLALLAELTAAQENNGCNSN
jgi:hypothetical protein